MELKFMHQMKQQNWDKLKRRMNVTLIIIVTISVGNFFLLNIFTKSHEKKIKYHNFNIDLIEKLFN